MNRIFGTLASANALALVATFAVGMVSFLTNGRHSPDTNVYVWHFLLGVFGSVGTLMVHCLIFTYFLGTGRWVKEVSLAYQLPDEGYYKTTRELKRRTFPPALAAMLVTIATSAIGAGVQLRGWQWPFHFGGAAATLVVNGWAFLVEHRAIRENVACLDRVLAAVDRIRAERGLPPNAEALQAEEAIR